MAPTRGSTRLRPSEGKERYFSGRHERRPLEGVGHFPQREAPAAVAAALLAF